MMKRCRVLVVILAFGAIAADCVHSSLGFSICYNIMRLFGR